ncbi:thiamine biosynthesis protein ThiF [Devosia pacifica]|uniref:Thiamine biosynthesis protein ThiF n=1 Tax=Devosia pacifica TaxID=1335967 RepID=A0A918VTL0_9HYPH|nr:HesA/MoeB/ThiF family protein [Devosia pacifica]GHA22852.1 thiamine biosynthesis protein ThiF [Devosia pacifica]
MTGAGLTSEETRRYARHLVLKGFGGAAQNALKSASVLVVGAGGLGSPIILYLAAAGIGQISVVDDDAVSLSNLQRQIAHTDADIGINKALSATNHARLHNDRVRLVAHPRRFGTADAELLDGCTLAIDATDNVATRRELARACASRKIDLIHGAVSMFDGQLSVIAPHRRTADGRPGPDLSALYDDAVSDVDLPSCEANGILGPVTGVIGTLMAMEAIKLISGVGTPLVGRLLVYDGRDARFTELAY